MGIEKLLIPKGYKSKLDIMETEIAIKVLKDKFEKELAKKLDLTRVSAPLFVKKATGLNDDLNGVERPVGFDMLETGHDVEIVQSLAKWKRMALSKYGFEAGKGLYTDMNAIRRDEELDNIHSIYVDQWDWEKVIAESDRNVDTLKSVVTDIYEVFKITAHQMNYEFPQLDIELPNQIHFITSQELLEMYPDKTAKEREYAIAKEHKAVFIMQIGCQLSNGEMHDGRAADYDDWNLNGDIIFFYPVLDIALELSSMGIRVDSKALIEQCKIRNQENKLELDFQKSIIEGTVPFTIGGGIGQSRICMFFLQKAHIGEVQASIWDDEMIKVCEENGINLL
ncbi:MAG: aspartate--ammonia ligase [Proteocatella sp.]